MKDRFTAVYVRRAFTVDDLADVEKLTLGMRWDDGFVAYLNGHEIVRRNVIKGEGGQNRAEASIEADQAAEAADGDAAPEGDKSDES